ncbi:hypothetical protein Tco_0397613 [Tanacetum coccineum]
MGQVGGGKGSGGDSVKGERGKVWVGEGVGVEDVVSGGVLGVEGGGGGRIARERGCEGGGLEDGECVVGVKERDDMVDGCECWDVGGRREEMLGVKAMGQRRRGWGRAEEEMERIEGRQVALGSGLKGAKGGGERMWRVM